MPIFEILGKKWTLEILKLLTDDDRSFSEIEKLVKNPKTTSDRLKELEELKIVEREVQQDKQRTVKYGLTELGKSLVPKIEAIEKIFK
ncbi:MAG: winged helix-turn-helix transcriptional regulator [Candidatus Odinarchaeota archaeon]